MDYREYRKIYGPGGNGDGPKQPPRDPEEKRPFSSEGRSVPVTESPTGSVTRFFPAGSNSKKRSSKQDKNSAPAKIVMASIIAMTFLLVMVTVLLFVTSDDLWLPSCLAKDVTVEAGRRSVKASDFLVEPGHTAEFVDEKAFKLNSVGIYKVKIRVDGGKTYTTKLKVKDTVAPQGSPTSITVRVGTTPNPSLFVKDIIDATSVSVTYKNKPDLSGLGSYSVTVMLKDEGGNETLVTSTVTVVEAAAVLNYAITLEAGSPLPDVTAFVGADGIGEYYSDISTINTSVIGIYSPEITVAGQRYTVQIIVQDTIAPVATVSPKVIYNDGDFPAPERFVTDIIDATEVTVAYDTPPVKTGTYPVNVKIRLTDRGGNVTVYDTFVTSSTDYTKPVITLLSDTIEIDAGDTTIIWRNKIKVSDNSGETPEVRLDISNAETTVPGTYYVEYVATDPAGNEARMTTKLVVRDNTVSDEMLEAAVKELTDKIITSGMTTFQKMYAVYTYLSANKSDQVHYANDSPHDDWRREAYVTLTSRKKGDCFAFAAVSQAIFRYLGFDTVMVQRAEECRKEHGTHFWLMINIGSDEDPLWYHFDATPMTGLVRVPAYGLTTAQLRAYTLWRNDKFNDDTENYYVYDTSLYPTSCNTEIIRINEITSYYNKKGVWNFFY